MEDRSILAAYGAEAVRLAVQTTPRATFRPGKVLSVRTGIPVPEASLTVDGNEVPVNAQCLIAMPRPGDVVLVMFVPPSGAFTIPYAKTTTIQPRVRVRRASDWAIFDSVISPVPFDTVDYDTHQMWTGAANSRLTIPKGWGGRYAIDILQWWNVDGGDNPFNNSGARVIGMRVNGSKFIADTALWEDGRQALHYEYDLNDGDYVEMYVYASGTGVGILGIDFAGDLSPSMMMRRVDELRVSPGATLT